MFLGGLISKLTLYQLGDLFVSLSIEVLLHKIKDLVAQQDHIGLRDLADKFLIPINTLFKFFFELIQLCLDLVLCGLCPGLGARYGRRTDRNGQIAASPHIIQNISVAAVVQRPELVRAVRGILQFQRAAGHGQPCAILRGQGIAPGVVVRQCQGGRLVLGDQVSAVHAVPVILVRVVQDRVLSL